MNETTGRKGGASKWTLVYAGLAVLIAVTLVDGGLKRSSLLNLALDQIKSHDPPGYERLKHVPDKSSDPEVQFYMANHVLLRPKNDAWFQRGPAITDKQAGAMMVASAKGGFVYAQSFVCRSESGGADLENLKSQAALKDSAFSWCVMAKRNGVARPDQLDPANQDSD